jgi:hypothetical protein
MFTRGEMLIIYWSGIKLISIVTGGYLIVRELKSINKKIDEKA